MDEMVNLLSHNGLDGKPVVPQWTRWYTCCPTMDEMVNLLSHCFCHRSGGLVVVFTR